jgi:hypothetical protein
MDACMSCGEDRRFPAPDRCLQGHGHIRYDDSQIVAAMEAQAKEILRAAGRAGPSQKVEMPWMASVGRAGVALANLVVHWLKLRQHEAELRSLSDDARRAGLLPPLVQHLIDKAEMDKAEMDWDKAAKRYACAGCSFASASDNTLKQHQRATGHAARESEPRALPSAGMGGPDGT